MEKTREEKIKFLSLNLDTRKVVWECFAEEELDRVIDALWIMQECEAYDEAHRHYEDE